MNESLIGGLVGLSGVILGILITVIKDALAVHRKNKEDGSYAAIRLICLLYEYANKCIDVVEDAEMDYGPPMDFPDPPIYPDDIVWRSVDAELMYRILALPNLARSTNRHIERVDNEYFPIEAPSDREAILDARAEGYARIGLEAIEISGKLKRQFGIEAKLQTELKLNKNWNPERYLRSILTEINEKRRRDAEQKWSLADAFSKKGAQHAD